MPCARLCVCVCVSGRGGGQGGEGQGQAHCAVIYHSNTYKLPKKHNEKMLRPECQSDVRVNGYMYH